jgi:hypothetical protein
VGTASIYYRVATWSERSNNDWFIGMIFIIKAEHLKLIICSWVHNSSLLLRMTHAKFLDVLAPFFGFAYIQSDIFFESKGAWKVRVPVRLNAISNGAVGP